MALSNSHITDIVESLSEEFSRGLNDYLKREERQASDTLTPSQKADIAEGFINQLLETSGEEGFVCAKTLTLETLNDKWTELTNRRGPLVNTQKPTASRYATSEYEGEERAQLDRVIRVQLNAIAKGFHLIKFTDQSQDSAKVARPEPGIGRASQRVVEHHHYHHHHRRPMFYYNPYDYYYWGGYGYHYHRWNSFYWSPSPYFYPSYNANEWMIVELFRFFNNCFELSMMTPSRPSSSRSSDSEDKSGELTCCAILAGMVLVAGATIAMLYSINELSHTVKEIFHAENITANTFKAATIGIAAWQGVMLGLSFATSMALPPVFGAICMSIILSGVATAISKYTVECLNSQFNTTSAISNDPRFCLSSGDIKHLQAKGFDTVAVNEAIRETGTLLKRNKASSLAFWSEQNRERHHLIQLMRDLKSGNFEKITINGKAFDFKPPLPPYVMEAQPGLFDVPPPSYDASPHEGTKLQAQFFEPVKPSAPPPPGYDQIEGEQDYDTGSTAYKY